MERARKECMNGQSKEMKMEEKSEEEEGCKIFRERE
jgi:hypothetical protein